MKKIILTLSVLITIQLTPLVLNTLSFERGRIIVSAQITDPGTGGGPITDPGTTIKNPLTVNDVEDLLAAILSAIVQIAIPFLVLAVMWVGFLFVAARGNPNKLAEAKQALFYTLLGALIVLGAKTLSVILSGTIKQLTDGTGN